MIELKTFYEQAQKLRIAQKRRDDLLRYNDDGSVKDQARQAWHIARAMEEEFDCTLENLDKQLRIAPEQINADEKLKDALEVSLIENREELEQIKKQMIDQSIIDDREGTTSYRYRMFEKRFMDIQAIILDAENKLAKVSARLAQTGLIKGTFRGIVVWFCLLFGSCDYISPVVGMDPQIEPYVESFFREAELRGHHGLRPEVLNVGFKDMRNRQGTANPITNTILIDRDSPGWKYNPEALVFHELGHLLLGRDHLNTRVGKFCVSIMSNVDDPVYDLHPGEPLYERRTYYVDELFNPNTEVPEWMLNLNQ